MLSSTCLYIIKVDCRSLLGKIQYVAFPRKVKLSPSIFSSFSFLGLDSLSKQLEKILFFKFDCKN